MVYLCYVMYKLNTHQALYRLMYLASNLILLADLGVIDEGTTDICFNNFL